MSMAIGQARSVSSHFVHFSFQIAIVCTFNIGPHFFLLVIRDFTILQFTFLCAERSDAMICTHAHERRVFDQLITHLAKVISHENLANHREPRRLHI